MKNKLTKSFQGPFQILLVEDNADHAELVARCLEEVYPNASVVHLNDGKVALDYLTSEPPFQGDPSPHFVLLDLRLPKVDGLEILSKMKAKEHLLPIPVIVLSSSADQADISKAYEHYANSYLVKPHNYDEFLELLTQIGHYWAEWNQGLEVK